MPRQKIRPASLRPVAEIIGPDPFGLREALEDFARSALQSVDHRGRSTVEGLQHLAGDILAQYLQTIDHRTTGADALSLSIVSDSPA